VLLARIVHEGFYCTAADCEANPLAPGWFVWAVSFNWLCGFSGAGNKTNQIDQTNQMNQKEGITDVQPTADLPQPFREPGL
jgi:hypothetical protein